MKLTYKKMVFAAVCLALCMVLPFFTGQIPQIGKALSPMHIPVLLCGFIAGPWYAAAVGAIAPLLRTAVFHAPVLFPTGIAMCFELAAYGAFTGMIYKILPKKTWSIYAALVTAMLAGRVVWGIVTAALLAGGEEPFTWQAFVAGAFIKALPGIILHIVLVPMIVMALERAKLLNRSTGV